MNPRELQPYRIVPKPRKLNWLRGLDLNQRPSGYEPDELPGCSTPRSRVANIWVARERARDILRFLAGVLDSMCFKPRSSSASGRACRESLASESGRCATR